MCALENIVAVGETYISSGGSKWLSLRCVGDGAEILCSFKCIWDSLAMILCCHFNESMWCGAI